MAKDVIPQDLLIYRDIMTTALAKITNEMYARNIKISYKWEFLKIEQSKRPTVFLDTNKPLYVFRFFSVDKSRNPIGETIILYTMFYPKDFDVSIYKLERNAIQDWFTNGSKALYNEVRDQYLEELKVKQAKIDALQAGTESAEMVAAKISLEEQDMIAKREKEILSMISPIIKP